MAAGNKFLAPVGLYQLTDQMISCFKVMEKVTNFIEFSFKSNIWFDTTLDTWIFFFWIIEIHTIFNSNILYYIQHMVAKTIIHTQTISHLIISMA